MNTKAIECNVNGISYTLTRKKVKNINMRIAPDGKVQVSANMRVSAERISAFVASKAAWIATARAQALRLQQENAQQSPCTKAEALALFTPVSDKIFPIFADVLGGVKPVLRVRLMKTRWGVCNIQKKSITLNMRLVDKPYAALEYVVMHEYAHFIVPNHSSEFHALMARLCPDYKERKKLLK